MVLDIPLKGMKLCTEPFQFGVIHNTVRFGSRTVCVHLPTELFTLLRTFLLDLSKVVSCSFVLERRQGLFVFSAVVDYSESTHHIALWTYRELPSWIKP